MYEDFYSLSGSPFQLNPDPTFYYESKGHRRAHLYLLYGVSQGEGFIVVTGEVGAGKTTLARALLAELDPKSVVAAQLVNTQLDPENLLRSVAVAFGLLIRTTGKAQPLAQIEAFLASLALSGRRALLVVDEAQNLTPQAMEVLHTLTSLQSGGRALLQCFLIGQPELRALMRGATMQPLRQRIIASCHLGPMEEAETRAYIVHRLGHVGWQGDPTFEEGAFTLLYRATRGIPRRINSMCNRLLLAAYLAARHRIGAADVKAAAAELRVELGAEELPSEIAAAAPTAKPAAAPSTPAHGPDFLRSSMASAINARLDRLERNLASLLELVRASPGGEIPRPAGKRTGNTR